MSDVLGLHLMTITRRFLIPCFCILGGVILLSDAEATAGGRMPKGAIKRLEGHKDHVTSVAVSSDGTIVATTSRDGTARLYDAATDKSLAQLRLGDEPRVVWSAAFAPDGRSIALAHEKDGISIWSVPDGKLQRTIPSEHAVYTLAFSPDGSVLTAETADTQMLRLWDPRNGKMLHKLERYNPLGRSVAISPNGEFLAAVGKHALHVWDLQSRELVMGRAQYDFSIAFSPAGVLLALAGDHYVSLVDLQTGKKLGEFRCSTHTKGWRSVAFSPDGFFVAGADASGARVWDIGNKNELMAFPGHGGPVTSVAFTNKGKTLVSGSEDGTAILWDLASLKAKEKAMTPSLLFDGLRDKDKLRAYGAFCRLRAAPKETWAIVEKHLTPAAQIPPGGFTSLLDDLESKKFDTRTRAIEELKKYGAAAEKALRVAKDKNRSLETVRRIEQLLALVEIEWPRTQWCLKLLEELPMGEAHELLATLSKGEAGSRLTAAAAAAHDRLQRRKGMSESKGNR